MQLKVEKLIKVQYEKVFGISIYFTTISQLQNRSEKMTNFLCLLIFLTPPFFYCNEKLVIYLISVFYAPVM